MKKAKKERKEPQLATWLSLTRTFQLSMALACAVLNGYLMGFIIQNRRGLALGMVGLELLSCALMIGTSFAMFFVRRRRKSHKSPWLVTFVVLDYFCTIVLVSVNMVLSRAGLPTNDTPNSPLQGFSTIRSDDGSSGHAGELDKFCFFERTIYFVCLGLIFSYLATTILTVLLFEKSYTLKACVDELLPPLHRSGVPARRPVAEHGGATADGHGLSGALAEGVPPEPALPTLRGLSHSCSAAVLGATDQHSTPRQHQNQHCHSVLQHQALPPPMEEEDEALAATVSDGTRAPELRRQEQEQRRLLRLASASPPSMTPMREEDEKEEEQDNYLDDDEQIAEAALVANGMWALDEATALPPYSPGLAQQAQMAGHRTGDSNETRLSGYVKGLTRAQDMKDSGGC